jgi:hypothetical protein
MAERKTNGARDDQEQQYQALMRSAALLGEEDLGRLTSASVLLAAWNEARQLAKGDGDHDELSRADYHLGNIRKRLGQARRAGYTRAGGPWLEAAWEKLQHLMWEAANAG